MVVCSVVIKSFRSYILENWNRDGDYHAHEARVGVDRVRTTFVGTGKKNYHVNFRVNDSIDAKHALATKDPKRGRYILSHVHNITNEFIRKQKPKSIAMTGNTDKKDNVYSAYRDRLARQHSGYHDADAKTVHLGVKPLDRLALKVKAWHRARGR